MAKITQHVVPNLVGGWSVKKGGSTRATRNFEKKTSAVSYARKIARNQDAELVIHKRDGTLQNPDSYGLSQIPAKGKVS